MLPAKNRLRRSADFSTVVRSGARARRGSVVLHLHHGLAVPITGPASEQSALEAPKVGLIVGKSVGNSVIRHQVSRRLRAQLAARVPRLPLGSYTVVRALPASAASSSQELGSDLDAAIAKVLR
ncbi:ribonuclease P protein component [Jatrophihabitans sp. GAS493]|uniref:ribonuclease P protein component n=1 Tax=Jatrophihabitans sp. GAS493 TaxID=1907575 RepID=UPI000BB76F32|nr:ribonuclease P protein component [Jatrophihabitans sp. GAS493]SOD71224.1 ribonuclease P protein component [Jatrophihabitans sp. GAS493]